MSSETIKEVQDNDSTKEEDGKNNQASEKNPKSAVLKIAFLILFILTSVVLVIFLLIRKTNIDSTETIENKPVSQETTSSDIITLENGWFLIKDNKVYAGSVDEENLLGYADAETFEYIPSEKGFKGFFRDKNYLYNVFYSKEDTRVENSDPSTFEFLSSSFAKDKNQAYFSLGGPGGPGLIVIKDIDIPTFKAVNYSVAKDKNKVIYVNWEGVSEIEQADPATISIVDKEWMGYTKDKNNVYHGPDKLEDAQPNSFKLLGGPDYSKYSNYSTDGTKVFYCRDGLNRKYLFCLTVEGANTETFQLVEYDDYLYGQGHIAEDRNRVYSQGVALENSDSDTFEIFENGRKAKDSNNSYELLCEMTECKLEIVD